MATQPTTTTGQPNHHPDLPHGSETFGATPKSAEVFRTIPQHSDFNDNHTLTVREAARAFESAGVARTERSIVNWCQPGRTGVSRLDCFFDPNDRKYYITPQSLELAIQEEKAKAARNGPSPEKTIAPIQDDDSRDAARGPAPRNQPPPSQGRDGNADITSRIQELEKEVLDLRITNRAKDYFIEELKKDRESFSEERKGFVERLMGFTRKVGELETRLKQLVLGVHASPDEVENDVRVEDSPSEVASSSQSGWRGGE